MAAATRTRLETGDDVTADLVRRVETQRVAAVQVAVQGYPTAALLFQLAHLHARMQVDLQVAIHFAAEQEVVDQNPDNLPSAESWPSTEPGENFVSFIRVDDLKNADGSDLWDISQDADDLAICEKMREVKDELFDHPVILEDLEWKAGDE